MSAGRRVQSAKRRVVDARRMGMGKFRVESYEFRGAVRRLKYNGRRISL